LPYIIFNNFTSASVFKIGIHNFSLVTNFDMLFSFLVSINYISITKTFFRYWKRLICAVLQLWILLRIIVSKKWTYNKKIIMFRFFFLYYTFIPCVIFYRKTEALLHIFHFAISNSSSIFNHFPMSMNVALVSVIQT
jgi:hypothetical protein